MVLTTQLRHRVGQFFNLSVPIRLAYAFDSARHAEFCHEQACEHYGTPPTALSAAISRIKGFRDGMCRKQVPNWFLESWFKKIP